MSEAASIPDLFSEYTDRPDMLVSEQGLSLPSFAVLATLSDEDVYFPFVAALRRMEAEHSRWQNVHQDTNLWLSFQRGCERYMSACLFLLADKKDAAALRRMKSELDTSSLPHKGMLLTDLLEPITSVSWEDRLTQLDADTRPDKPSLEDHLLITARAKFRELFDSTV